ncbi:MAG: DUF4388 domain-containing protein [Deltaproteobacteria bacterium]|nr:DUF4388 domain-containing protein [Deltaproteobacteria bacterium]
MQGKITDFSIPDIFQLIASQGKSGSLKIRVGERETAFLFSDGLIVDVQPDRRDPAGMIGAMLVDGGILTGEQLRRILALQEKSEKKLGEVLVGQEMISREALARYLTLQIKESLFDVLRHREGEYRFESFAVRPPLWMGTPIRADVLMMEGMQFLDEYAIYREKFPPGDFRVARKRGEKIDTGALSEEERAVWKAIDFSPEPRRIFRKAGITWFEGVKGLWFLMDRGLLEITRPEEKADEPGRLVREELARRRKVGYLRAAAWTVAAAVTSLWVYTILLSEGATRVFADWVRFF